MLYIALIAARPTALALSAAECSPNIVFAIAKGWGVRRNAQGTPWVGTPHYDRLVHARYSLHPRLHAQRQMRALPRLHPHWP